MASWGWRVPFLVGCLIIPLLFFLRRSLTETEDFLARRIHPSAREIIRSVTTNWRGMTIGTMLAIMTTVSFYIITAYTPTFGRAVLHLATRGNLIVTLCV